MQSSTPIHSSNSTSNSTSNSGSNSLVADIGDGPDNNTSFQGRILHLIRYKVIVCTRCGIGLIPGTGTQRHLKDYHKDWPLKD
jgi:hypothetical protein